MHVRWLPSLTRITDSRQLIGIYSVAAFLQLELFRVYAKNYSKKSRLSSRLSSFIWFRKSYHRHHPILG
ncbi:hypothetical protein CBW52_12310 [Yersinia kristensenii]|uniref:Uncharacterized protein n=1 Tax=Yersinia kristensenii TaxID=28152 RepID=A0AB73Q2X5_YERKR|nr:hypothetical protein CBW52_12310 [Yersinia kristensenii]